MSELTLEELFANVLRDVGWIMAGGSAQFRQGTLAQLDASLRSIYQQAGTARILQAIKVLREKAAHVAASGASDAESILGLRRVLEEFEQAMKAYLATLRKR